MISGRLLDARRRRVGLGARQLAGLRLAQAQGASRSSRASARPPRRTCEAMRAVAGLLAAASHDGPGGCQLWLEGEPLRLPALRAEVARVFAERGLEQPRGNIFAPAEEGAVPHTRRYGGPGDPRRRIAGGGHLPARPGLFADCTRTFCVGEPPEPLAEPTPSSAPPSRRSTAGRSRASRGWDLQERSAPASARRDSRRRSPSLAPPAATSTTSATASASTSTSSPPSRRPRAARASSARVTSSPSSPGSTSRRRAGPSGSRIWSTSVPTAWNP